MHAPFISLRRHARHGTNFYRQAEIEAAIRDHDDADDRHHHHAGAKREGLGRVRTAEADGNFDEPVGSPGKQDAQTDREPALDQGERIELDCGEEHAQRPVPNPHYTGHRDNEQRQRETREWLKQRERELGFVKDAPSVASEPSSHKVDRA